MDLLQNDPQSTVNIWERVGELGYDIIDPIVIMNCRQDSREIEQKYLFQMFFPKIQTHTLVGIGEVTEPIKTAFEQGKFPNVKNYIDLEYANPETIIEKIYPLLQDRSLFGVGNIHGQGEEFIEKLLSMSTDDNSLPRQNQTLVEENKETENGESALIKI